MYEFSNHTTYQDGICLHLNEWIFIMDLKPQRLEFIRDNDLEWF